MKAKYNVIDLFCGAGGMSVGFEQSGFFNTLLGTDHDLASAGTYKINHLDSGFVRGNVCYASGDDICYAADAKKEDIDVVIGGTPCQGFSTLGKRLVEDPRNLLFCEFARLVKEIDPPIFVLENVGGMRTMKDGENNVIYDMVKNSFHKVGYEVKSYLLNAVNYGVPQERKRLFFIGCKHGNIKFEEPKITHFADGESMMELKGADLKRALTIMDAIGDLPEIKQGEESTHYLPPYNEYQKNMKRYGSAKEVSCLTLHYSGTYSVKLRSIMKTIPPGSGKTIWQLLEENPERVPKEAIPTSGFKNTYGRLSPDRPSMTITRNFSCVSSSRCIHPFQNRSLTPREAARIQSFKDDYIFINSDVDEDMYEERSASRKDIRMFASFVPDVPAQGKIYILRRTNRRPKTYENMARAVKGKRNGINLLIGNAVPPLLAEAVSRAVAKMLDEIYKKRRRNALTTYKLSELQEDKSAFELQQNFKL